MRRQRRSTDQRNRSRLLLVGTPRLEGAAWRISYVGHATPRGRIYFVADSGYGDGHYFRNARERHGPFKLAILPIGAYEPRWFMRDHHMNPSEAVQALIDCGAEVALAHHHGTFQLTDEPIDAPFLALAEALNAAAISPERFPVLRPGQVWQLPPDSRRSMSASEVITDIII